MAIHLKTLDGANKADRMHIILLAEQIVELGDSGCMVYDLRKYVLGGVVYKGWGGLVIQTFVSPELGEKKEKEKEKTYKIMRMYLVIYA